LGYDAVGSTHPAEALKMIEARPESVDLVITDMTMPGMTGDQLAAAILNLRPDMPIIICTGFSKRLSSVKASSLGIRAYLMKPVTVQELSHTVRDALDEPASDPQTAN
jgi:DNA-binding NtrC family response regulator